jgi:hypothetical protein
LVEPGNVSALVAMLGGVMANAAACSVIAAAGRQWAEKNFTVAATVKQIEAALKK